ncbi:MAG: hypothetical protein RR472_02985, partial [Anaerovoracaceae bacterium]
SMELSKIMITGGTDKSSRIDRVKTKAEELEREKVRLLAEANIPVDYMNVKYRCEKCKDTGVTDTGEKCSCYIQVKNEVEQLVNPTPNG